VKVAALDLGTNTFLCLIAEVQSGKIGQIYEDQVQVVRLGQGMGKTSTPNIRPQFHPEALKRAETCLKEFSKAIQKHRPEKILAMATSAARDASNAEDLFRIGRELQIPIEIIPGSREAEITYQGSISGQKDFSKNFVVIDIGGGSTEIIFGKGSELKFSQSLDIGCVRLTEKFLATQPASAKSLQDLRGFIAQKLDGLIQAALKKVPFNPAADIALAVAGTPTELARIQIGGEFTPEKIDGFALQQRQLNDWFSEFSLLSSEQITQKFSVTPGRADVILVGVIILQEFCRTLGIEHILVSTRGVRFGVALEIEKRKKESL